MADAAKPRPVKLITGIIAKTDDAFFEAEKALTKAFGQVDYKSQILKFDFTDYYEREMGAGLKRRFISFKRLIDPKQLAEIKLFCNKIESRLAKKIRISKRPVNIDPGYITDAKLILASTKDYSHRVYLNKGIYGEVTLYYQGGVFRPYSWTYPDYRTDDYRIIFDAIRKIFMQQITVGKFNNR
jgi:hypothetical protein